MRARGFLTVIACLSGAVALPQASGIGFVFPEFCKVYEEKSMWGTYQIGMNYQHDFNERLSMAFDVVLDLQRATEDNTATGFDRELHYQGYTANYTSLDKLFGMQYRTAYAFSDNDETHLYMGTFIGYRKFTQEVSIAEAYDPNTGSYVDGPFVNYAKESKALFPVGLRLGLRGGLEGGFADLYMQYGRVIGGGASIFSQPYLVGEEFDLTSTAFTLGLAYGFGW